jgi:hypothetical protein
VHALAAALLLVVQPAVVSPGDAVTVRVAGPAPAASVRVYLSGLAGRLTPVGTLARGHRRLVVRLPRLDADVYAPAVRAGSRVVVGRGRLSVRALPPAGFGPLGAPGCTPASPRSGPDAFGTAAGAQLWGLFAFNTPGTTLSGPALTYESVVGKEEKIVFRMTSGIPTVFFAVAPDGTRVAPVWGPEPHLGSSWARPGAEWGAGFVFDVPGCWHIHAGAAPAQGDLWIDVRS